MTYLVDDAGPPVRAADVPQPEWPAIPARRPALLATTARRPWRRGSSAGTRRFTGRGPPRVARG